MSEPIEIRVQGPGPYGFRLFGGDGDPMIVAKLRKRSKAYDAGLREGDVVLGINGRTCQTTSHGIAMTLLESAADSLNLHIYRGSTDPESILLAYKSLGSRLRPVSPETTAPNRSISAIQPFDVVQPTSLEVAEPKTSYSKQEVTSVEGKTTQKITTETETQDLGGVTLTKVTRHLVAETNGTVAPSPAEEKERHPGIQKTTIFHVPKFKVHPLLWTPAGTVPETGKPSDLFHVNRAVTVDITPVEDKQNSAPDTKNFPDFVRVPEEPTRFKVHKTSAKPSLWQPGFVPAPPEREPTPAFQVHSYVKEYQPPGKEAEDASEGLEAADETGKDPYGLTPQLIRVLTTEGPQDELELLKGKKKIFADSSFYDDPEQKYPTIEEQIKMARKVALSLSAPDNVTARGQRMFMKRKEKSNFWTTDLAFEGLSPSATLLRPTRLEKTNEDSSDIFYHPTPWKVQSAKKVRKVVRDVTQEILGVNPEDMIASSDAFVKNRALFQRGVAARSTQPVHYDRSGKKVSGKMASHECVGLTNDLRGMKGRGAKLFAQRRAKAAEEEELSSEEPRGETGVRERGESSDPNQPHASVRRLEELISISKAYLSPWESGGRSQSYLEPWQRTPISEERRDGENLKDDLWRPGQKTTEETPSFIGKPTGVYRPVRFPIPTGIWEPVSDF